MNENFELWTYMWNPLILNFSVSGRSKQTSTHIHAWVQWSHASVGLTQAHPNDFHYDVYNCVTHYTVSESLAHPAFWKHSSQFMI